MLNASNFIFIIQLYVRSKCIRTENPSHTWLLKCSQNKNSCDTKIHFYTIKINLYTIKRIFIVSYLVMTSSCAFIQLK